MLTAKDILSLPSNLLDAEGEDNQKLTEIFIAPLNIMIDTIYPDILKLNYLDDLEGKMLDNYGKMLGIYRNGLNDKDYRALLKTMQMLRLNGTTFNNMINGISGYLDVSKTSVKITEPSTSVGVPSRHIAIISIDENVDIYKLLAFVISIKAAGIIIDCWEYTYIEKYYRYNYSEYGEDVEYIEEKYNINCHGEIVPVEDYKRVYYEFDLHEFDLSEKININDK